MWRPCCPCHGWERVPTAVTIVGNSGDIARFGGDVDRYVAYAGLAPSAHQNGAGEPSSRPRRRYNRYLKNAFMFMALNRLQCGTRAQGYYQWKRREGKKHWAALRVLARYLCRIAFRILTTANSSWEALSAHTHRYRVFRGQVKKKCEH